MKKHRMIHTGEKPYPCWICGQSFRRKETRDTHVRYHTRERQFACKMCDKKYISKSHLRVLIRLLYRVSQAWHFPVNDVLIEFFFCRIILKVIIRINRPENWIIAWYAEKAFNPLKASRLTFVCIRGTDRFGAIFAVNATSAPRRWIGTLDAATPKNKSIYNLKKNCFIFFFLTIGEGFFLLHLRKTLVYFRCTSIHTDRWLQGGSTGWFNVSVGQIY